MGKHLQWESVELINGIRNTRYVGRASDTVCLYTAEIRPIVTCGSEKWTMTPKEGG